MRVFYGAPKGETAEDLAAGKESLQAFFNTGSGAFEVVTGFEDWDRHGLASSGFPGWIARVAIGMDYATIPAQPIYSLYVIPVASLADPRCGKATAQIVEKAIGAGKKALAWQRDLGTELTAFALIGAVFIDHKDWKTGGQLVVSRTA